MVTQEKITETAACLQFDKTRNLKQVATQFENSYVNDTTLTIYIVTSS